MTVRLFSLLNSADIIYVDSKESDGVLFDDNCLPGRKVPTARVLFESTDYYFLDQDVELVDGECVATAEDWEGGDFREECRLRFDITKPLTLADILPAFQSGTPEAGTVAVEPATEAKASSAESSEPVAAHGDVNQPIPRHHFIGEGRLPFLIIGRVPGDDDDTGYLVMADDESQAQSIFVEQLHDDAGNDTEERVRLTDNYKTDHFITTSQGLF